MSHTDKTQPYWVKLKQNPQDRVEEHDHRKGICDLDPNDNGSYGWTSQYCSYDFSRAAVQTAYQRCSEVEQLYRKKQNGKARGNLRKNLRDIMKTSRADLEDCDYQSFPHRHQALWDAY